MICYRKEKMNVFKAAILAVSVLLFAACTDDESSGPVEREDPSIHDTDIYTQAKSSDDYKNSKVKYGKMTDPRDGKVYRTIVVDGLEWMAENLDFSDSELMPNIEGANWCYDNNPDFCKVGGRLYTWAAAMNLSSDMLNKDWGQYVKTSTMRRGICPEGWAIPDRNEYWGLTERAGNDSYSVAGKNLKSTKGWRGLDGNGLDSIGFTALPTGFYAKDKFYNAGFEGGFWTSSDDYYLSSSEANVVNFAYDSEAASIVARKKEFGYSVRCVKDTTVIRIAHDDSVSKIDELKLAGELYDTAKVVRGKFVDPRDNREYRTVKIGNETWMAENMDYLANDSVSACYAREDSLCEIYGRLYTYEFARDSVCPEGWHLPTKANYEVLRKLTGLAGVVGIYYIDVSALTLKGKETWADYQRGGEAHDGSGLDLYGFDVLAGGRGVIGAEVDSFFNRGENAHLWVYDNGDGYYYTIDFDNQNYKTDYNGRGNKGLASVRCIQGEKAVFYECPIDTSDYKRPSYTGTDSSVTEGGYLQDMRDNKFYKVVTIGKQTWMAENLNAAVVGYNATCYKNNDGVCDSLGMYYTWDEAMDLSSVFTSVDDYYCRHNEVRRGMCPKGWHLPSEEEWRELIETAGDSLSANRMLKSKTGWQVENGFDTYGFDAVPGGFNPGDRYSTQREKTAYYWARTEATRFASSAIAFGGDNYALVKLMPHAKSTRLPIRCLKDSALVSEAVELQEPYISLVPACRVGNKDKCTYGTLKDERDEHVYKTVQIGTQTWMAENLEFASEDSPESGFYFWSTAVDTAGVFSENAKGCERGRECNLKEPVRGICPEGWHVPSMLDWEKLFAVIGGETVAWTSLKSSEGWSKNAGVDAYGWNAVPTGYWYAVDSTVHLKGDVAHFWSWKSGSRINSMNMGFYADSTSGFEMTDLNTEVGANIRCLKDE